MVKMVKLKRTSAERRADSNAGADYPTTVGGNSEDHDGPVLHLDHHHLKKMGLDAGNMKHGDPVEFHGRGHVEDASTGSSERGERGSARIRMTHGGADHQATEPEAEQKSEIRSALHEAHEQSESRRAERGGLSKAKGGAKVAEK